MLRICKVNNKVVSWREEKDKKKVKLQEQNSNRKEQKGNMEVAINVLCTKG